MHRRRIFAFVLIGTACARPPRAETTPSPPSSRANDIDVFVREGGVDAGIGADLGARTDARAVAGADAGAGAVAVADFGPAGPVVLAPKVPPLESGMMDHAFIYAWTDDGKILARCTDSGGRPTRTCELLHVDGSREELDDVPPDGSPAPFDRKKSRALTERLRALGLIEAPAGRNRDGGELVIAKSVASPPTPSWRFARDVELTWRAIPGDQTSTPPHPGVLEVGARVHGEKAAGYAFHLKAGPYHDRIHPERIALSPDGTNVGVIAHAFAGEYSDTFPMQIVSADVVAARAYNAAGCAHHEAHDYVRSAELFRDALAADPAFDLAAYNLACAYARLGDVRAEPALADAIRRGGAPVRARARKDADFDGVRTAPWFARLTTE